MTWIPWAVVAALAVLVIVLVGYWLIVLTEGAYLGARAVRAIYDWGASSYDEVKQYNPTDEYWFLGHPLASRLAERVAQPLILDVATGTARLPLAVSRVTEFDGAIVGLDISRPMLAVAARKTQGHARRIHLVHHPAAPLPFADESFDAVTMLEALEFLPDPTATLREMVRVLRPGGLLMVTNRIGADARWLPGRAHEPQRFEQRLAALGLAEIETKPWQEYYDLIWACKPGSLAAHPPPTTEPRWLTALRCPSCAVAGRWETTVESVRCTACGATRDRTNRILAL